jgi:predicted amidophosphoribosyltransferase
MARKFFSSHLKVSVRAGRRPVFIPLSQRCTRCGEKWKQDTSGMCRSCAREAGDIRTTFQRDAEHVARNRVIVAMPTARPLGTRIIENVEYDVMFDGTWR